MVVNVLRGGDQIGGSIIEVISDHAKIILDAGQNLEEKAPPEVPEIEGLFKGTPSYDAVIISHYHADHTGLLNNVLPGIPIYMSAKTFQLYRISMERAQIQVCFQPVLFKKELSDRASFQIKDLKITPYLCDHSAFDSHMFLLEDQKEKIFYTGDFRSNGRKSFPALIAKLPSKVDKLIIEGTTLTRKNVKDHQTEQEIQKEFEETMQGSHPVFILISSMNIDRIVTIYKAAIKTGRLLAVDSYLADILTAAGGNIPHPGPFKNLKVYQMGSGEEEHRRLMEYKKNCISRAALIQKKFAMCIRSSRLMKNYLRKLAGLMDLNGSTLIYSLWKGYQSQPVMKEFLEFCESLGIQIRTIHTSGHADRSALKAIIAHVQPDEIIPVHTLDPKSLKNMKSFPKESID